jgi:hypothetical protein
LDFTAKGGKRQGREVPQIVENNAVEPGAEHPVWKTQSFLSVNSFFSFHGDVGGRIYFVVLGFSGGS